MYKEARTLLIDCGSHLATYMETKRHKSSYAFFYLIFSKDIWQICGGVVFALIVAPNICLDMDELEKFQEIIIWIMVMILGWSLAAWPASKISKKLQILFKKFTRNLL